MTTEKQEASFYERLKETLMNHYLPITLLASAMALLSGCSNENSTDEELLPTSAIRFSTYLAAEEAGRGTVTDDALLKTNGFGVMGYLHTAETSPTYAAPDFMNKQQVTYDNGTSGWTYAPLKYWPANSTARLDFLAYAPYGNANIQVNGSTLTFTVNSDPAQQTDLVVATPITDASYATAATGIQFTFAHLLSRIEFSAIAADGATSITLHSVALTGNFFSTGTVDLAAATPVITGSTPTGQTTYTLPTGEGRLFLIPTATATPSATIRYTAGETTTTQTVALTTTTFKAGKSYHIRFKVSTDSATEAPGQ